MPVPSAFNLRPIDEGQLSVNWMEFFSPVWPVVTQNHRERVLEQVGNVIQLDLSPGDLFVVVNVGLVKEAITAGGGHNPDVLHTPQPAKPARGKRSAKGPDPSHASVFGYTEDDNLDVAVRLLALVKREHVFTACK